MPSSIETIQLVGLTPYGEALELQRMRRDSVEKADAPNTLFLLEHKPVITLGRKAELSHLLRTKDELTAMGIDLFEVDRGGDVTYHGPGQMVAYPILNLNQWRPAIRWYLRSLEEVLIRQLLGYGLPAGRMEGYTGVWVNGAKVAAIGIGIHNWITFHGIALNVRPDMAHFGLIVPCGIADKPVTTLEQLLGKTPEMKQVMDDFDRAFRGYFETDVWREKETFV